MADRREPDRSASLDEILSRLPGRDDIPAHERIAAWRGGLAALVALVLLALLLCLPLVGSSAITINRANDFWNSLPTRLPSQNPPSRSVILAADGTRIGQFYSENRVPVTYEQIPRVLRRAIVAIEDSRFYHHHGVDVRGTFRAFVHNALTGTTQGGSTITQQYVKNMLSSAADTNAARKAVTSRTSYMRKVREARYALALERRESKAQILTGYLNVAYFGSGSYGIGTAARHYFNRPVRKLSLAQASLLAGLVRNPSGYDPSLHPQAARERRDTVLKRMLQLGDITQKQYDAAVASPIKLKLTASKNGCVHSRYPFFCQYIRNQIQDDPAFGRTQAQRSQLLYRGGLTIHTTLRPKAQNLAQRSVDEALGRNNRIAANAVVVQPGTGHLIAMATNRTFGDPKPGQFDKTQIVLPDQAAYPPGSNFKPFTLAAALERGYDWRTTWTAPSVYYPSGFNVPNGGFQNSMSADAGTMNAATALWRSSNTWFVHLETEVGVLNVASMAQRLGITSLPMTGPYAITPRDAALTLGVYDVSPIQLAGAYATFPAHGVHCNPIGITKVIGPSGNRIKSPSADCHQAIAPSVADTVANIMQGTIDGPDPARTGADMSFGRPAGGKTGTTEDNAAVWFSGFTPQFATAVEVSDPRGGFSHPLYNFYVYGSYVSRAYGSTAAGPIWKQIMSGIHKGLPVKEFRSPATTISTGTVVPDVRGLRLGAAYRALTQAGYNVQLLKKNGPRAKLLRPNRVYATNPAGGTFMGLRGLVRITMTAGSSHDIRLPKHPGS